MGRFRPAVGGEDAARFQPPVQTVSSWIPHRPNEPPLCKRFVKRKRTIKASDRRRRRLTRPPPPGSPRGTSPDISSASPRRRRAPRQVRRAKLKKYGETFLAAIRA